MLLAGIQKLNQRDSPMVSLDARQKRSGMTSRRFEQFLQGSRCIIEASRKTLRAGLSSARDAAKERKR
jgi:hypothetical protein